MEERFRTSVPRVKILATIPALERSKAEEQVYILINDHEGQRFDSEQGGIILNSLPFYFCS
jgi:hypothetical protein